jgi:hypothetical protein
MAEVAVSLQMFAVILSFITRLRARLHRHVASDRRRGMPRWGKTARISTLLMSTARFDCLFVRAGLDLRLLKAGQSDDTGQIAGNLENVG